MSIDFIELDNLITKFLKQKVEMYDNCKNRLDIYKEIDFENIGGTLLKDIKREMNIIENLKFAENILFLYKKSTRRLIENFIKIMRTPIQKNKRDLLKNAENEKRIILQEYINVIKTYIPHDIIDCLILSEPENIDIHINYCDNCENTEYFIKDNDVLICKICYSEVIKMAYYNNRSYNVNVSKCNYDRISHFKECLKQYQGKQNTFINPNVYEDLENAFEVTGIIDNNKLEEKSVRFRNVTKCHVLNFLKMLNYNKHYDDYILIHSNLTGKKANDISHLENILIEDFEKISEQYSILFKNEKKNFINIQYILYQLLVKHNCDFDKEDFISAKSLDRKIERDEICRKIFESLNWEYKISA